MVWQARFGRAWYGLARSGELRHGRRGAVSPGKSGRGMPGQDTVWQAWHGRQGADGHGQLCWGMAWQGMAGEACHVTVSLGNARFGGLVGP